MSDPPARSRAPLWFFAVAMALAVAGGGGIVLLAKRAVAERNAAFERDAAAPAAPPGRELRSAP